MSGRFHFDRFKKQTVWCYFSTENKQTWAVDRERYIEGYSSPDYVVLDSKNTSLIVSAESPFKITHDSMKPLQEPKAEEHRPMGKLFLRAHIS